jgi:hypothetical protein
MCVVKAQEILFFGDIRGDGCLARERTVAGTEERVNGDAGEASAGKLTRTGRSQQSEQEDLTRLLQEGLDVYDNQNHKIGTVSKVYPPAGRDEEFFIQVATDFLGLGHTQLSPMALHTLVLFIPSSYLKLCHGQVELTVERSEIDRMGWAKRPTGIRD